jgi:hypothetical protein
VSSRNKGYIYAVALLTILSAPSAISATEWLPYQGTLKPQVAQSLHKASLSPAIEISKPDANLPENIIFFSGIWEGSICHGFSDVKIAVTELTAKSASITYSLGNYSGSFNNQEYKANIIDGELVGRTKTGFEIMLGKRAEDKHLNIKWLRGDDKQQSADTTPATCYGVLKRGD